MSGTREQGRRALRGVNPSNRTLGGMMLAGVGVPLWLVHSIYGPYALSSLFQHWTAWCACLFLFAGSMWSDRLPRVSRTLASLSLLIGIGLAWPALRMAPFVALAVGLGVVAALAVMWEWGLSHSKKKTRWNIVYGGHTRGTAMVALPLWLCAMFSGVEHSTVGMFVVGWALLLANVLSLLWIRRMRYQRPKRARALLIFLGIGLVHLLLAWGQPWNMLSAGTWVAFASLVIIPDPTHVDFGQASWWHLMLDHPERLFVGTFAGICFTGALLLLLPQSTHARESIDFLDALFTSVSAVCVTGLAVLDTPKVFSGLGQAIIVILIQVGGLGIMTFSTVALWALGGRMSLRHEGAVASLISASDRGKLYVSAQRIIAFTFGCEAVGAVLLWWAFCQRGDGVLQGLWRAVFTSVSAFCNAGFALQTDNLISYQSNPLILHTVGLLIIMGGLSPMTVFAIPALLNRRKQPVPLQSRLSLLATAGLLIIGTIGILLFEWNTSLRDMSLGDALHNAWFQSLTLRTAGFNSVDLTLIAPATYTLMLVWMFIGGSPGGTAGGIKTTTASVLFLSVLHTILGRWPIAIFGRRIAERTWRKAAVTVTLALLTTLGAVMTLLLTQSISPKLIVFEVVSALGTVGLSIGATAQLDGIGKLVIILCMFAGRVGGLTMLMFLSQHKVSSNAQWPEEEIDVG